MLCRPHESEIIAGYEYELPTKKENMLEYVSIANKERGREGESEGKKKEWRVVSELHQREGGKKGGHTEGHRERFLDLF